MKENVKFFGRTLILLLAMSACEWDDFFDDGTSDSNSKSVYDKLIGSYNNEMVLKWNNGFGSAIDNLTPTAAESRSYAMVSLVMHDALNNIVPKYETYALDNGIDLSEDITKNNIAQIADAAVAQAAHDVSIIVAPNWKDGADGLLVESLSKIEESTLKSMGTDIGKQAALAILEKRQKDSKPMFVSYGQGTLPGEYKSYLPFSMANPSASPEDGVYASDCGILVPFGITSGVQFRPGPPYQIYSPEYTTDYNEVKRLGCNDCPDRTQDQLEIGIFFIENSPCAIIR